ncbi:MAG: glycosyltransferase family 4 protein [Candidatus Terrybacteria bacterium]|nr:glycosyltransferase family 4 protein [Candidatus Terrybacteria bacterium]
MDIGIHAVAAFRVQPTGVERYLSELLRSMAILPDASAHRFLLYTNQQPTTHHQPYVMSGGLFGAGRSEIRVLRALLMWTQLRLSWEMLRFPPDVLFLPAQALPRALPKSSVATIHGVEFLHVPDRYPATRRRYLDFITRDALRRSRAVIVPSDATKGDLLRFYDANPEKVHVVPHGLPAFLSKEEFHAIFPPPAPYFLYLGRLELNKNVDGIVRAFTRFRKRNGAGAPELVLAGTPGFGFRRIRGLIGRSSARDGIHLRGYVSESEKQALLRGAVALLFPSWAEGFGFPILEAHVAGVPVVTSSVTAMPEVAGQRGALFVVPGADDELAEAIERLTEDRELRRNLITSGQQNIERFSWERAAASTLRILTEAAA